jgi:cytochrome P450
MSSANRDPRAFSDPDAFDITRSPNPHVAFGGGIHHCLGAALARVEGQETFRALAETLPRLHLQEDHVEYVSSLILREVCSMNVTWS